MQLEYIPRTTRGYRGFPLPLRSISGGSRLLLTARASIWWPSSSMLTPQAPTGKVHSQNYGSTWVKCTQSLAAFWESVTSDSTGMKLAAAAAPGPNGGIWMSVNGGVSWSISSASTLAKWQSITSDASGSNLVAVLSGTGNTGQVYYTRNRGANWFLSTIPEFPWYSVTSDSTGQFVATVANSNAAGQIYLSNNYGESSYQSIGAPALTWYAITSDSTGLYLAAAALYGGIYTDYNAMPSAMPTSRPTSQPVASPSSQPSASPTMQPSSAPSRQPSAQPSSSPTLIPTAQPLSQPTAQPSMRPSSQPTSQPSALPTVFPSSQPSSSPSSKPSGQPSSVPSMQPTGRPSAQPSARPSAQPSGQPSFRPSGPPTAQPSTEPSAQPSSQPSRQPSAQPSSFPTVVAETYETSVAVTSFTPTYTSTLSNLGHGSQIFVTANMLLSFLSESSGGYVIITAGVPGSENAVVVSSTCAPPTACSADAQLPSTYCAVNVDVTAALESSGGGLLTLTATSDVEHITGSTPTLCNRQGQRNIYFEVNYTVSAFRQPTLEPTYQPTAKPSSTFNLDLGNKGLATAGGAPFYVVAFAAAAYTALAVLVVRLHDSNEKVTPHRLLTVCSELALQGYSFVSEVFFIVLLFQANSASFEALAIVMILSRVSNLFATAFLLRRVFPPVDSVSPYRDSFDRQMLFDNTKLYAGLLVVMTLDVSTFKYFPWRDTEFAFKTGGFPDLFSFRLCNTMKVLNALVSLIVQCVVLGALNSSGINNKYTLALFVLYLIATVVMFVVATITVGMQVRLLTLKAMEEFQESQQHDSRASTGSEFGYGGSPSMASFSNGNPLHDGVELSVLSAARISAASAQGRESAAAGAPAGFGRSQRYRTRSEAAAMASGAPDNGSMAGRPSSARMTVAGVSSGNPVVEERVALLTSELQEVRANMSAQQQQLQVLSASYLEQGQAMREMNEKLGGLERLLTSMQVGAAVPNS